MSVETATMAAAVSSDAPRTTLVAHFLHQVRTRSESPALYYRSGDAYHPISWGQFGEGSQRLVGYLLHQEMAAGDHVGIWSSNRPEWHVIDAAILCARGCPVPIYLTLSAEQAQYVLHHSETKVLFVENRHLLQLVLSVRDQLPALRQVVVVEGVDAPEEDGFVIPYSQALSLGAAELERHRAEIAARESSVAPDDVVTLIYTSGTTGPPKAVPLTHRNVLSAIEAIAEFSQLTSSDRMLSYLPLAHVAERMVSEFRSYEYGNATYFLDGLPNMGTRLKEVRPTQFFGVPRVWEKMAAAIKKEVSALPQPRRAIAEWAIATGIRAANLREAGSVPTAWQQWQVKLADKLVLHKLRVATGLDQARILASGAAPLDPAVFRFFRGIGLEILEVYGQSESSGLSTINRPGHSKAGTVGPPLRGTEIRIAPDGEVLVRSALVFPGYYKDPAASAEILIDGWLHTGDVGEFDDDGYLRITDRKKDLIITAGGKNISPGNLEMALSAHPLVGHAVAIGDKRPYIAALLTLDPEEAPAWARRHGVEAGGAELTTHPTVLQAIQEHIDSVNSHLSNVERIKQWKLLEKDFALGEELTPTLKVKRKVVNQKYESEIEGMYHADKQ